MNVAAGCKSAYRTTCQTDVMDVRKTELAPLAQLIRLTNTSVDIGTAAPSNMPPASREPIGTFGEHRRYPLQTRSVTMSNPKTEPTDNAKKDPDEWLQAMTR